MQTTYKLQEGMKLYLVVDFNVYEGELLKGEKYSYFIFYTSEYDDPQFVMYGEGSGYFCPLISGIQLTDNGIIYGKHKIFPTLESAEKEIETRKQIVKEKYENDKTLLMELFKSWRNDESNGLYVDIVKEIMEKKFDLSLLQGEDGE